MSETPLRQAGRIYVLPPPLTFRPPRHTQQLREQLKAQDDAAFADTTAEQPQILEPGRHQRWPAAAEPTAPSAQILEPFGQRLRHTQDLARAKGQGYAQGYMDGLSSRVHVTPGARIVSAALGAVAGGLTVGVWATDMVRAWW